jgi:hypothetical protein
MGAQRVRSNLGQTPSCLLARQRCAVQFNCSTTASTSYGRLSSTRGVSLPSQAA